MSEMTLGPGHSMPRNLPAGWNCAQLNEVVEVFQGGRLGLTKEKDYISSGALAFSAAGPDGFVNKTEFANRNGVILSAIGANCGRCFYAEGDWTTLANVQAILPRPCLDARFLFYRVNQQGYWERSGSAQPFIKPSSIKKSWIAYPTDPLAQQTVSRILLTLDTQIEATEKLIAKQERVRAGLMQDLFTRGVDQHGKLRPPRDQAPHLYHQTDLGWLPLGWEADALQNLAATDITYGIVQAGPHELGGIPYIRTGDMSGDALDRESLLCTTPAIAAGFQRSRVQSGEIVIAIRATIGKALLVPPELDGANLTQGTARFSANGRLDRRFALRMLRCRQVELQIGIHTKGTTFSEITLGDLRTVIAPFPTRESEQRKIAEILDTSDNWLDQLKSELAKLRLQKSGLMQDLLTGTVSVAPLLESGVVEGAGA